ncbi:hypothetical protein A2U01_0072211, partial [Trifolium medium]|nr:hypothetical protein [Trifolium medium]
MACDKRCHEQRTERNTSDEGNTSNLNLNRTEQPMKTEKHAVVTSGKDDNR